MQQDKIPKGQADEVSDKFNSPGVYEHPETGERITCYPGKRAVVQADAFTRLGFKRVDDVPSVNEIAAKDAEQTAKARAEADEKSRKDAEQTNKSAHSSEQAKAEDSKQTPEKDNSNAKKEGK